MPISHFSTLGGTICLGRIGCTSTKKLVPENLEPDSMIVDDEDPLRRRPRESTARRLRHDEVDVVDGKRNDQMAFHALADYQNHVIGWLQSGTDIPAARSTCWAVVRFPRIWMSSAGMSVASLARQPDQSALSILKLKPRLYIFDGANGAPARRSGRIFQRKG